MPRNKCVPQVNTAPKKCLPFDLCVGNKVLSFDGDCLQVTDRQYIIPDGTFTSITFQSGCITGVGQAPEPGYTPSECCATPSGGGGGTPSEVVISPEPCNLTEDTPAGILTRTFFRAGSGITITGCGTALNPTVISSTVSGITGINAGSESAPLNLTWSGAPANALLVSMNPSGVVAGDYAGFSVNSFGLITAYTPPTGFAEVRGLVAMDGIEIVDTGGAVFGIGLNTPPVSLGTDNIYFVGRHNIRVNQYGQIISITEVTPALTPGSFEIKDPNAVPVPTVTTVSYNENGCITSVVVVP